LPDSSSEQQAEAGHKAAGSPTGGFFLSSLQIVNCKLQIANWVTAKSLRTHAGLHAHACRGHVCNTRREPHRITLMAKQAWPGTMPALAVDRMCLLSKDSGHRQGQSTKLGVRSNILHYESSFILQFVFCNCQFAIILSQLFYNLSHVTNPQPLSPSYNARTTNR
jgi:hypothetical protein